MKRFAIGFFAIWALALLFDVTGSLDWPNPLDWSPGQRQLIMYLALVSGAATFVFGRKS